MSQEKGDEMKKGEGVEGIHRGQDIVKLDGWGYADSGTRFSHVKISEKVSYSVPKVFLIRFNRHD